MKIAEYKQMMEYLTRPGFNGGGSVRNKTILPKKKPEEEVKKRKIKNFEKAKPALENPKEVKEMIDKPKRGLVDEPGKYSQESKGPGKGNPGVLREGRASKLSAETKKYINKRYNKTGKSFDKWWPTIGNPKRQDYMNAFDRVELSKKELTKLKKKNLISMSELNEILTKAGKKTGKIADFINDSAYQALKPKVVEGIYASQSEGQGKVRDTFFKKPNAQQIKNILALHTGKGGNQPALKNVTIEAINNLIKDKPFVNFLKKWNEGDDIPDKIIKKIFSPNAAYNPNTIARYSQILDGSIPFEGVKVNKELAEKIKKGIKFEAGGTRGSWQQAARNIAIREFDKIFNPAGKSKLTFASRQSAIKNKFLDYGLKGLSVDEILAMRTGYTSGQSPYSMFSQVLTNKMNTAVKNQLDGQTSKKALRLQEAIKEYGVNSKQANKIRLEQNNYIKEFKINNPEFEKVNLPKFSFKSPQEVLGERRFFSLPKEAQTAMKKTFKEQKFTPDLGKNLKTQKELAQIFSTKKGALGYLNKLGIKSTDTAIQAASKIKNSSLPNKAKGALLTAVLAGGSFKLVGELFPDKFQDTAAIGDGPIVQEGASIGENVLKGTAATGAAASVKPGRDILKFIGGKAASGFNKLLYPLLATEAPPIAFPVAGYKSGKLLGDIKRGEQTDSTAAGITSYLAAPRIAFDPRFGINVFGDKANKFERFLRRTSPSLKNLTRLLKGSVYATPVIETGIQGYNAYQALQDARKNASVFEPRVDTALGEAPISYYNKIMSELPEVDRSSAAGGGIMKMAGRSSGPAPESGPTPQGLDFLMKRGR